MMSHFHFTSDQFTIVRTQSINRQIIANAGCLGKVMCGDSGCQTLNFPKYESTKLFYLQTYIISDKSHDTMISLISPLTCITIITFPLPHVQSQDPGQGTDVQCQQGFVPSNSKVKFMRIEAQTFFNSNYLQLSLCDPCIDTGVAYPGNNINRVPSYDVSSVAQCQGLCRDQDR